MLEIFLTPSYSPKYTLSNVYKIHPLISSQLATKVNHNEQKHFFFVNFCCKFHQLGDASVLLRVSNEEHWILGICLLEETSQGGAQYYKFALILRHGI